MGDEVVAPEAQGVAAQVSVADNVAPDASFEASEAAIDSFAAKFASGGFGGGDADESGAGASDDAGSGGNISGSGAGDEPDADPAAAPDTGDDEGVEKEAPAKAEEEAKKASDEEVDPEKKTDKPGSKEEYDKEFRALTKRRQQIAKRAEEVERAAEPIIAQERAAREQAEARVREYEGHAQKAIQVLELLEKDPVKGLEALGWDMESIAQHYISGQTPQKIRDRQIERERGQTLTERQQLEQKLQEQAQAIQRMQVENLRAKVIPLLKSDLETAIETGDYAAVAALDADYVADQLFQEMANHAAKTGKELDFDTALDNVETRHSKLIRADVVKTRRASSKPEKKPKPAKQPEAKPPVQPPKAPLGFETEEDSDAYIARLAAKHFS